MLGVFRQFGVAQALRASAPRTVSARWTPQLCRFKPLATQSPVLVRSFQTSFPALKASTQAAAQETDAESELITKFADLQRHELIDGTLIRNVISPVRMGLETMTEVQSQTIHQMLQGNDVLAQAKTGTGKTLAFLLPTMQNILNDPSINLQPRARGYNSRSYVEADDIRALIISPTRELAEQIAAEARKMTPGTGLMVQTAVGGTQKRQGLQRIQQQGCHLLVGTPGRIKDIFSDRSNGVSAPKLNTLILDEADRLLDQGFSEEIEEIQALLPNPEQVTRQTLMFSATVPKGVMKMVERTMRSDYKTVKTVRDDETPVHLRVPQRTVFIRGYENRLPAVLEIAKEYQARQSQDANLRPFKAIVYFNSTAEVQLAAEVFQNLPRVPNATTGRTDSVLGRMNVLEIHSRLTQRQRTYSADAFRRASSGILFSSDVTARGMDFPDVTHVIQVGLPSDRETYIHRTGRTARANKTGEGWILLHDGEVKEMDNMLSGIPLQEDSQTLHTPMVDLTKDLQDVSPAARAMVEQVQQATASIGSTVKQSTWRSQLGHVFRTFSSKRTALETLNRLAVHGYGLTEPPTINPALAQNLGISRYRDLVRMEGGGGRRSDRSDHRGPERSHDRESSGRSFGSRRFGNDDRGSGSRGSFSRRSFGNDDFSDRPRSRQFRDRDSSPYGSRSRY
ncbi:ATP-dependent RNA helicase [Penicillium malachiteum]|nr:ATP-dependent RNA helicase [Penicillium malachiteum]